MNAPSRIIVNTAAQHIRSVFNVCLSLYSARLILQALGQSDYGIYSLVASIVAMLSFLTNAMVVTTQRHLSFMHGKGDAESAKRMFSNCLLLHILTALGMGLVFTAIEPLLFNGFLVIDESRLRAAEAVYFLVIVTLLITFLTAPYRALFIARENIVYISVVDVLDAVIKLCAAFWLLQCPFDRLIAYALIVVGIMVFNFLLLVIWSQSHFPESLLFPRKSDIDRQAIKGLTNFAGWTIYSQVCVMGRTQGIAILLNRFFGTTVNAAYGIAQHVFGAIYFIAVSVVNAISPQLMAAEGNGDRTRMVMLAEMLSKYAFLLLSVVAIPLMFEMPNVLGLWLGEVPDKAVLMCRAVLLAALADLLTTGLSTANQATGKVKNYSLLINTQKVLTLPLAWLCLKAGGGVEGAMWCYVVVEVCGSLTRLPFMKKSIGLSLSQYAKHVFGRIAIPFAAIMAVCTAVVTLTDMPFRFLLTGFLSLAVAAATVWACGLEAEERRYVLKALKVKQRPEGNA